MPSDIDHRALSLDAKSRLPGLWRLPLTALIAGCAGPTPDAPAPSFTPRIPSLEDPALWDNGGFENDNIAAAPSGNWSLSTYLNASGVSGTSSSPPATFDALNLGSPGTGKAETFVVGGTALSQYDPDLGSGQSFRFPLYENRSARVNYLSLTENGKNKNANVLSQSMVLSASDVDASDGLIHIRFAVAPVLENPSHGWNQQPFYYYELKNTTKGTTLFHEFNTAGQSGVPWRTTVSVKTGNTTQWLDWKLVDIAPGSTGMEIGDTVKLTVVASGCALGGHFGRVYVDGIGSTIPGPYTWATADKTSVAAGSTLTYTFHYGNGGGSVYGAHVDFTTPPQTTFASIAPPTGITCTTPSSGATGVVSCPLGVLSGSASGSFTVTVNVGSTASGSIVNGNYAIGGVNVASLSGATVTTPVTAAPSSGSSADFSISMSTHQALYWGQTSITYDITVTNKLTSSRTAITQWTAPAQLTNVTWCRMKSNLSACSTTSGTSGTGNLSHTQSFSSGQVRVYRITANVVSGSGTGSITNSPTVAPSGAYVDTNPSDNSATVFETIGTTNTPTLSVTKSGGASKGTIVSSPAGINIGTGATSGSWKFGAGWSVTLTASPTYGNVFNVWSGTGITCGSSSTCTIAMSGSGTTSVTATFAAASTPTASAIYVYSGSGQMARTSTAFSTGLAALVTDTSGTPVSGATVTFAVPTSGATASLSSTTATTDSYGVARVTTVTANGTAGAYAVTASTAGVTTPASFDLRNVGSAANITYVQGGKSPDVNAAIVGGAFGAPLMVLVTDAAGYPTPGVSVTFSVPGSGASGTLSSTSATTDSSGFASVTVTANTTTGTWHPSATTGSLTTVSFDLQNTSASPAAVYVVSGTPQRADASPATAFPLPLLVVVADSLGNPVPNTTVTFTRPTSGATATLSSSTATTNSVGRASVTATTGSTIGTYTVAATVALSGGGTSAPANFTLTNLGANTITITAGDHQSAIVGATFSKGLTVQVLDSSDNPVSGATVTFTVPTSDPKATLSTSTATTNSEGIATSVAPVAGNVSGTYTISATTTNAAPVTFTLTNVAGAAKNVTLVSGNSQSAEQALAFDNALVVRVTDAHSNVVEGATVTFTAPSSGAKAILSSTTGISDAAGLTAVAATANTTSGSYSVTATVPSGDTSATFSLTNTSPVTRTISVVNGTPQSAAVGSPFGAALVVLVEDSNHNPIAGVDVEANEPASGAIATLSSWTATTDGSGHASITATAGSELGSYDVTISPASGQGVTGTATFHLTNTVGPAYYVTAVSGGGQSQTVNTNFASSLVVLVTDAYGHPVSGLTVTSSAPGSGATASQQGSNPVTDSSGNAAFTFKAGTVTGSYNVTATTASLTPASFSLTNTAGDAASLAIVSGSGQSAMTSASYAAPLVVAVKDAYNNNKPGVQVTFSAPTSGASASLGGNPATTNSVGQASVTATAGTTTGAYNVAASVTGLSPVNFSLTNDNCPSDATKLLPGVCGCGVADTDSDGDGTANCIDGCPSDAAKTAAGICGCGVADTDSDSDGTANCIDGCPSDAAKTAAGICGCGVADTDSDRDGTANCIDGCPSDASKTAAGVCGCGVADTDSDSDGTPNCHDGCPSDASKTAAGACGCGVADTDSDGDGAADCNETCDTDPNKTSPGACGCGVADTDSDGDGAANCNETCDNDPNKTAPGICGCGVADTNSDGDAAADCNETCDSDPNKTAPGVCGCGVADTDSDSDGTPNCNDGCPSDASKTAPGVCGCGVADTDSDSDGTPNCHDACPSDAGKTAAGACGCGTADTDSDHDTSPDCLDACPSDAAKISLGDCGCGVAETDTDTDGTPDCIDACPLDLNKVALGTCGCGVIDIPGCVDVCPADPNKSQPGACGCNISDADSDYDGTPDCLDGCPADPVRTEPGICGCGVDDSDSDGDGVPNCQDLCPDDPHKVAPGACGCAGEHRRRPGWKRLMCEWVYER